MEQQFTSYKDALFLNIVNSYCQYNIAHGLTHPALQIKKQINSYLHVRDRRIKSEIPVQYAFLSPVQLGALSAMQ